MSSTICLINAAAIAAVSLAPLLTNSRRTASLLFGVMGLLMSGWLVALALGFMASDRGDYETVGFYVRLCFILGFLPFTGFDLLRLSLTRPELSIGGVLRAGWGWPVLALVHIGICTSDFFLRGVTPPPTPTALAIPNYGPGVIAVGIILLAAQIYSLTRMVRAVRAATGMLKVELTYMLIGLGVALTSIILFTCIIPAAIKSSAPVPYGGLGVLALALITAYGIATERILDVGGFMRRVTIFGVATVYLVAIFFGLFFVLDLVGVPDTGAYLASSLLVAFSFAPANSLIQHMATRLFGNLRDLELKSFLHEAERIGDRTGDMESLHREFRRLLKAAAGTDDARIYLRQPDGRYTDMAATDGASGPTPSPAMSAALQSLTRYPLAVDALKRRAASPADEALLRELRGLGADVLVPIRIDTELVGMIALGPRLSGRIYSGNDQENLQLIGERFALALQHLQLNRELMDEKAYTDRLVHELSNGLVTIDQDQRIVTYNRAAAELLGIAPEVALGAEATVLPPVIAQLLERQLAASAATPVQEIALAIDGTVKSVSVSAGLLQSPTGEHRRLAYVLLGDRTRLRQLEDLVRENDRLSIVGTLAAGIAHEIKNPLLAVGTFAQLLPERLEDEEFLREFSALVASEVERVNVMVHRLLSLSQPHVTDFGTVALEPVLTDLVNLLSYNCRRQQITVQKHGWDPATPTTVRGNTDLLRQAFLNLLLNAIDAMPEGGDLTISVDQQGEHARIRIADTGVGIAPEELPRVFELFHTSKTNGTGLGLSITRNIVDEHQGELTLSSTLGAGSEFVIRLPRSARPESLA